MDAPHSPDFKIVAKGENYLLHVLTPRGREFILSRRTWLWVAPSEPRPKTTFLLNGDQAMRLCVDCYFDGLWIQYERGER